MAKQWTLGVDGCRAGWFAVALDAAGGAEFAIYSGIAELWQARYNATAILIDIPIGLVSGAGPGRLCDAAARKLLTPRRHNTVFTPPCRQALSAKTYAEACRINARVCGRKISIQAWGISRKIKEVDDFLQARPESRRILRETHPEICFRALAGGHPMVYKKKSPAGQSERLDRLEQVFPGSRAIFQAALKRYPRKALARDDILDALANAVTALNLKSAATLPEIPPRDRRGLPMEIVYTCR